MVTVQGGGPLHQRPWGRSSGPAVPGVDRGGAAAQYVIQTASQAVPREAYQVGPLHFGLAERGGVTALGVRTGGAAARVALGHTVLVLAWAARPASFSGM